MDNDRRGPLLITSFRAWRSHQPSNSSQDLIAAMQAAKQLPDNTIWLSHLPVHFELAPIRVINAIYQLRPRAIVCCGMAENRACLSLERQAKGSSHTMQTSFNLDDLLADTHFCEISNDAGSYVCNALYYQVLDAMQKRAILRWRGSAIAIPCLFVHVPVLKAKVRFGESDVVPALIQADMLSILDKICA